MEGRTPRERARAATVASIKDLALAQLSTTGAGELSLRAIARELNLVSSGIYRYYPSRDELITALIVDAYEDLALVLRAADNDRRGARRRWIEVSQALRVWAVQQPHRFGLIYGTPIPGYLAPPTTVEPAGRVLTALLAPAIGATLPDSTLEAAPASNRTLRAQLKATAAALGLAVDPEVMRQLTNAFAALIGLLTLELGGHLVGGFEPADDLYSAQVIEIANRLGL